MRNFCTVLCLVLLGYCGEAFAAETRAVRLLWGDAIKMAQGRKAEIATTSGAKYKGRVIAADADTISVENGKARTIPRAEVAEIKLIEYVGNGRHTGKLLGGMVGLLGGLIGAVAIGMNETSTHKDRDKALATVCALGGFPGGLTAGYLIGRLADKETTFIRIIPQ